ncbi:MAG: hypothetical protein WCH86_06545 [Kiritimatiellales bacterium]
MGKPKSHTDLTIKINSTDRSGIRAEVFQHWINEEPGTSLVRNTYRYNAENLSDGTRIYLTRPTRLNKGADFVICCEGFTKFKNGNDKPPRHEDLMLEFAQLGQSLAQMRELLTALRRIWDCENSVEVLGDLNLFKGNVRAERALLLAKWFFIEQDVTYWTESGRHMLRDGFEGRFGKLP